MKLADRQRYIKPFVILVVLAGAGVILSSVHRLPASNLDLRFLLLLLLMVTVGARLVVHIPSIKGEITVNDTLIFLTMLLCGGEAAILMAAISGFCSSLRVTKKGTVHFFNSAMMACSTFLTVMAVRLFFGEPEVLTTRKLSAGIISAVCLMAVVQYVTNSGLATIYTGCKMKQTFWSTWRKHYLWSSITYFAGASAALLIGRIITVVGFYGTIATAPIIAIVYFTYQIYLKNVETSIAQAEHARRHAEALEESEERFRIAFGHAPIGMALVSPEGKWLQVNQSLCQIVGYSEKELLAMDFQSITNPDDLPGILMHLAKVMAGELPNYQIEQRYLHKQGREVRIALNVSRARSACTESSHFIFQIQDITARKVAEDRLLHDAFHDALTGLPNRALFTDHLRLAIGRTKRNRNHLFTVLFLDLDRFKIVNDSLGHLIGDRLLVAIARRLEKCLRPGDTVARLGGDEFTVLLEDLKNHNEATAVAERIQMELIKPFDVDDRQVFTSVSIGIAHSSIGYDRPEDILRDADTAMYHAKSLGGTRHKEFDRSMHAHAMKLLQMQTDLRTAMDRKELVLYYQPIVSLDTFNVIGFEALVRWLHPERGLIGPDEFIPVAEEMGLIVPIGDWVLREACRDLRRWHDRFPSDRPLTVSVNFSGTQLLQPGWIEQIEQVLAENELDPHCLRIEITESVFMDEADDLSDALNQLRKLGVGLCIDDFGTGYSSLSRLHRFPVSTLKIDRSFVSRMDGNDENREIIRTIMSLAQNMGLEVVAEGVETVEQIAQLRTLGCECAQGFFFSEAGPVEAADAHLTNTRPYITDSRVYEAFPSLELVA